ncbi:MAG: class I adenylate-forming enzyme family protein [Acidimicrobiales bacterium]
MSALAGSLKEACERWADRPAITFRGTTTVTYRELWRQVEALADFYRSIGIRPGDRIVCQFRNCTEYIVVVAAAWECGAIHVGTDNDLTGSELAWLVDRTEASVLAFQPLPDAGDELRVLGDVRRARAATKVLLHECCPEHEGHACLNDILLTESDREPGPSGDPVPAGEAPALGPDDTAVLHLTSGTTGRPKAVMETPPAFWAKMQFFADAFDPGPDDVMLLYLPMGHVFGIRLGMMTLLAGGRLVLMERFSPRVALRAIAEEGVTVLPGMPTHLNLLLSALDGADHDVSSLRWVISAAATLPPGLAERVYERLGVEILFVYGCSENFTTCTVDRDDILVGSVGNTVYAGPEGTPPDGTIRAVSPLDHTPLPAGEVGELAFGARGPVHYWKAPDAATDGRYYTGDLGRVDPDGRVYVLGRLKELVNRGGLKVSPSEVEAAIVRHPGVADAAVVGTPDPVLGEAVCTCIVPAGDHPPSLTELRDFLGQSLARHKLPDELALVDGIPRTVIGKVDRPALVATVLADDRPRQRLRSR